MNKSTRYSPEIRDRAVRMVFEHQAEYDSQWAAIGSIAQKIGCTAETLRKWVPDVLSATRAYGRACQLNLEASRATLQREQTFPSLSPGRTP